MNKLSKSVLERIEKDHIKPRSKWYFILKNLLIGLFSIFFIILGVIACTMIFQFLSHIMMIDMLWDSPYLFLKLLWFGIPLFWIIFWVILFSFGMVLAHESKHGYKITWKWWALMILILQIGGGLTLYQSKVGDRIDQFMGQMIRQYERAEMRGRRMWRNPENGFLGGEVSNYEEGLIMIKDRVGKSWSVDITSAHITGDTEIQEGGRVRFVGEKTGESQFRADMMKSMKGRPGQKRQGAPPTRQEREQRRKERQEEFKKLPPELQEKIKEKRDEAQKAFGTEIFLPFE